MIRVRDLEKSLDFYTRILGMQVLRQKEYPGGKFTNTFVGYGPEETHPAIELTYNWDQEEPYDMGNGWGHVALEVPDVYAACEALQSVGANITRAPGPMKNGTRVIAFVEDPDG
jgi:lactoylglutathione lyase